MSSFEWALVLSWALFILSSDEDGCDGIDEIGLVSKFRKLLGFVEVAFKVLLRLASLTLWRPVGLTSETCLVW
jgi:hypothetical protein